MAGYFVVIPFLSLPVFIFIILLKKKKKKKKVQLNYIMLFSRPLSLPVPTKFGAAKRANLISRFWRDSISPGFIFPFSTGKYEQGALNFAIQVF